MYLTHMNTAYHVTHPYTMEFTLVTNATQWFWFLGLKHLFSQGCNYSNEANENDGIIFYAIHLAKKKKKNTILTKNENKRWNSVMDGHPIF